MKKIVTTEIDGNGKRQKRVRCIFSETDKKMLLGCLPVNPCSNCTVEKYSCCGCSSYFDYMNQMKSYVEQGLEEYVQKIQELQRIDMEIGRLKLSYKKIYNSLPNQVKEIIKLRNKRG